MIISDKFRARHALLDLENTKGIITSNNPENVFEITLIKVPTHTVTHKRREVIDEGGGWYSKGDMQTISTTFDNQYLAIKDNECIGIFEYRETKSGKLPLMNLNGFKYAKELLKTK